MAAANPFFKTIPLANLEHNDAGRLKELTGNNNDREVDPTG